ncbi:MAG: hypothetical protein ACI3XI_03045 [Eubacteriales bacterium]
MMTDERLEGYAAAEQYAENAVSYEKFDTDVQSGLNLFALREDMDLAMLDGVLDRIIAVLPSIKRIFALPIIRLRDSGEILPAEAVRVVNNKTLSHIAVHSELWESVKGDALVPRKLMTVRQDDDYAIYENLVFAQTIDLILSFVAKNQRILQDMLHANRELRFNLLERENHPMFFIALGKLHTGYLRDYDQYLLPIERCSEKLRTVENALSSRLKAPVYRQCRKRKNKLELKKTNIFRSHKDYRRLYSLAKYFSSIGLDGAVVPEPRLKRSEYFAYCSLLCVFAAGHFNFRFDDRAEIDFKNIDVDASFGGFALNIRREHGALMLTVRKEREYKTALCLYERADIEADEVLAADPNGDADLRLDLHDIDSFRRIQQLLLRAMVYADGKRDTCPFCGKALKRAESGGSLYECGACRTVISEETCPDTGESFYLTAIKNFRTKSGKSRTESAEGVCRFRNITPVTQTGETVCPRCGKVHGKN